MRSWCRSVCAVAIATLSACASDPVSTEVAESTLGQVAAGDVHACALGGDGNAFCWGDNSSGQLGNPAPANSSTPVRVVGGNRFAQLTSAGRHTCALSEAGEAWCWGANPFGQLGNGTTVSSNVPVRVSISAMFKDIDAGPYHVCAVTTAGAAWCWGANGPLIRAANGRDSPGFALGAASTENCANPFGTAASPYRGTPWPCSRTPAAVAGGHVFQSISAGVFSTCGLEEDGSARCWGWNTFDQLGTGTSTNDATVPTLTISPRRYTHLSIGATTACGVYGLTGWCWGGSGQNGNWGALGSGSFEGTAFGAPVANGRSFSSISTSDANNTSIFTCGLSITGDAYCWGANTFGQLGTSLAMPTCSFGVAPQPCSNVPLPVDGGINFIALATGAEFVCAITRERVVMCWGRNEFGQLGDGTNLNRATPVVVAF